MSLFSTTHRETGVGIPIGTHTKQLGAHGTRHVEGSAGVLGAGRG